MYFPGASEFHRANCSKTSSAVNCWCLCFNDGWMRYFSGVAANSESEKFNLGRWYEVPCSALAKKVTKYGQILFAL